MRGIFFLIKKKNKMKFPIICHLIIATLICFTNGYALTRLNHRFDTSQLITGRKVVVEKEAPILFELKKLEQKFANNKTPFTIEDLKHIIQLIGNLNDWKQSINTPHVYWYSRMGR